MKLLIAIEQNNNNNDNNKQNNKINKLHNQRAKTYKMHLNSYLKS
jgi:hypothetical protein